MSAGTCPYCYRRLDDRRLWYRCTGRGVNGQIGCRPDVDVERARATGWHRPEMPSFGSTSRLPRWPARAACPTCAARTGIRVCPHCHTPLPATFDASRCHLIAVVGALGSGKTVYLSALGHALRSTLGSRFGVDVGLHDDDSLVAVDHRHAADRLMTELRLPPVTPRAVNGTAWPALFQWRPSRPAGLLRRYRGAHLAFYDSAGSDLTNQSSVNDLRFLEAAGSVILLVDPFLLPRARDRIRLPDEAIHSAATNQEVLRRVTEGLRTSLAVRAHKRITTPVAVVVAKLDAFFDELSADHALLNRPWPAGAYDEQADLATHEQVRRLLMDWGAEDIDHQLRGNYSRFRYFAVSALGAQPDYTTGRVNVRGVHPFRVDEPLLWLLATFNLIP